MSAVVQAYTAPWCLYINLVAARVLTGAEQLVDSTTLPTVELQPELRRLDLCGFWVLKVVWEFIMALYICSAHKCLDAV
jgi:hypothetical protein